MKRLIVLLLLLLWIPCALAETRYVDGVDADRVHLRMSPDATDKSLGLYFTGAPAEVVSEWNGWLMVQIGVQDGWMRGEYLGGTEARRQLPVCRVNNPGSWVNLRIAPTMEASVLTKPEHLEWVTLLGETADGWSYVEYGGLTGYMVSDFLERDFEVSVTKIVGTTEDDRYIHAYAADNGQTLYFTAHEQFPRVIREDVNFDGMDDIVVHVALGASNFFSEFFVMDGGRYVRAEHPGIDYALCNYQLHPELELVSTYANNGSAGALNEQCIFRWDGTGLTLVRRAVSEELTEWQSLPDRFVETTRLDWLRMRVTDYTGGVHEGTVIHEAAVPLDDSVADSLDQLATALWQGVR